MLARLRALLVAARGRLGVARARRQIREIRAMRADPQPALSAAIGRGDAALVRTLLGNGLDPGAPDAFGGTPLMHAAWLGRAEIVGVLLRAGADPDSRNSDGSTALHLAVDHAIESLEDSESSLGESMSSIAVLLEAGADPEARDLRGRSPVDWAQGVREITSLLAGWTRNR